MRRLVRELFGSCIDKVVTGLVGWLVGIGTLVDVLGDGLMKWLDWLDCQLNWL